jgi:CRP-like cAMP-binding protein
MTREGLPKLPILAELESDERVLLADLLEERRLAPGSILFSEGDDARTVVFVESGVLKVERRFVGTVGTLGAGEVLGGAALVLPGVREATCTAVEPACVLELDRAAFRRLVADAPHAACRLLESVAAQIAEAARAALDSVASAAVDPKPPGPG